MWPIQKLIQLLNAKDEESLPLRVKQRIGAMIRVVLPKWPGLSGIILRLCTTFGHPLVLCDVEGVQLLVDSRDKAVGHYLLNAIAYEPEELDLLRKCLKPGANFLDIGGNIGYFTIIAAKHVGPLGKVIAFEPEPHNFEILRRNVELNKLRNVMIENYAAVDQEKTLTLYLSSYNFGDHRIFDSDDDSIENLGHRQQSIDVQGVCLDEYLREKGFSPDFIKIDVQGAEKAVLSGLVRTLAECKDIQLLLEFWPYGMRQFGTDPSDVLSMLTGLGFHIFQPRSDGALSSFSGAQLDSLQGPTDFTNIFACRKADQLLKLGIEVV